MLVKTIKDCDLWNDFVLNWGGVSPVLQSWQWGEFKAGYGWKPYRLIVEDDGRATAGVQLLCRRLPLGRSLLYAPRGPLLDFADRESAAVLDEAIRKIAKDEKALFFKIDPALPDTPENRELLKSHKYQKAPNHIQPSCTYILDLTPDSDKLLASFASKTRYNIRLSLRKGVEVRDMTNPEGAEIFHSLLSTTAERDKFRARPVDYYGKIIDLFKDDKLAVAKLFLAYYNDTPVAGVFTLRYGSQLWYMYGASDNRHRNVMPNYALHWHTIQWAKEAGIESYDLWGIPENPNPESPLFGVYRFKSGFNGQRVCWAGCLDRPFSPGGYFLFKKGLDYYSKTRNLITRGSLRGSLED